jgi:hypothetical protein
MRHSTGRNFMLHGNSKLSLIVLVALLVAVAAILGNFSWALNFSW